MTNSKSDSPAQPQACQPLDANAELAALAAHIESMRNTLFLKAMTIAKGFMQSHINERNGVFSGVRMMVRRRKGSIAISWVVFHYKNGKRTGMTMVRKPANAHHYDLNTLEKKLPRSLHQAAADAEIRARPIREALSGLVEMARTLHVIEARIAKIGDGPRPIP
jgi:hypothetical protein